MGGNLFYDFKEFLEGKFNVDQMGLYFSITLFLPKRHLKNLNFIFYVLGTYLKFKPQ